jgi:hypothetical protein
MEAGNLEERVPSNFITIIECCYWILLVKSESREWMSLFLCSAANSKTARMEFVIPDIMSVQDAFDS